MYVLAFMLFTLHFVLFPDAFYQMHNSIFSVDLFIGVDADLQWMAWHVSDFYSQTAKGV